MISNRNKKRKISGLIFPAIVALSMLSLLIFLVVSNWKISQKREAMNARIEELRKEIVAMEEKNSQLKANISENQSQDYVEKIARENLNYKKEGEAALVVKVATTSGATSTDEKNFFQKIWDKVGL